MATPPLTLVEKIATRYAVGLDPDTPARQGQIIRIRPKHVMTHDNTGAVIPKFLSIFESGEETSGAGHSETSGAGHSGPRAPRIADPSQPVFIIDHDIQNHTPENLGKYAKINTFADTHAVDFYPAGTGISHQIMVEQGYATPGTLIVGSDSHSNIYGGVGALGTPVVRTDAACIWATGQTWWQVPKVARCTLRGKLNPGVVGKDVIIALCGLFNKDEVLNHAVEFVGDGIGSLSMDHRLTIANMTTEWGALAGIFPFDGVLKDSLLERADYFDRGTGFQPVRARPGTRHEGSKGSYTRADVEHWWDTRLTSDPDAPVAIELEIDLATITPHVAGPNHVKVMTSVAEMQERGVPIQKAYLVSCTNARLADIAEAAGVVKGKQVASTVEFYVAAASADIQARAEQLGHWQALLDAGARPLPPGCGPCIGLGTGLVEDGETAISATNRNFKGRMGSRDAEVYLGSPAVVAASAIEGRIAAPFPVKATEPKGTAKLPPSEPEAHARSQPADILSGFPASITGRALYLPADNMNTDGIFAGKWTYQDDLTPEKMAEVLFENYDPDFHSIYKPGDILIGARNFGSGSSREQAATALIHKGIPCVIAASFSETYRRNAFNNGFLCLECPALVDHLAETLPTGVGHSGPTSSLPPTIPGPALTIDFAASTITASDDSFPFAPLSTVAQELVIAGGAEPIARASLA